MTRGELKSANATGLVAYIDYDEMLVQTVTRSKRLFFFSFSVSGVMVSEGTVKREVTLPPGYENSTKFIYAMLGSIGGVVLGIFILILLLTVICVYGRKRKQERKKGLVCDICRK